VPCCMSRAAGGEDDKVCGLMVNDGKACGLLSCGAGGTTDLMLLCVVCVIQCCRHGSAAHCPTKQKMRFEDAVGSSACKDGCVELGMTNVEREGHRGVEPHA
jgi:hypothetical protein